MGKIALMFPGQGSQYVGMGENFHTSYKEVQKIYKEAEAIVNFSLTHITFNGPEEKLTQTNFAQVALFVLEAAVFSLLQAKDLHPDVVFGHSLGELSALYAAGVVDFENTLSLVKVRGELMQQVGEKRPGSMAAVLGLKEEVINDVLSRIHGVAVIANYNAPDQIVISGEKIAVHEAISLLSERGAKKVIPLKVSAAFHSPLMEKAAEEFAKILENVPFVKPNVFVIPNATAELTRDPIVLKTASKKQLRSPVLFVNSINAAWEFGTRTFIEIGPGKVLSGLVKRTLSGVKLFNVEKPDDFKVLETLK